MNHQELVLLRCSRRTYINKALSGDVIFEIENNIKEINQISQLTCRFVKDGHQPFASFLKTYGLFKNVKSFIVMKGLNNASHLKEKVGYYGEELILRLTKLGLGTCWVGGTYDKEKVPVEANETLVCLITVGFVDKEHSTKEKIIEGTIAKKRKSIEQRLVSDVMIIPKWMNDGLEMVIYAPSAKNSQKPMFTYKSGILTAAIEENYRFDLVDLGIAKRHFEIGAGGRFELGNGALYKQIKNI